MSRRAATLTAVAVVEAVAAAWVGLRDWLATRAASADARLEVATRRFARA